MLDRFRGALVGMAVGDAVGTTVEFMPPGSFHPVTDMVGGGPFNLEPGEWTDDTSMALCLAESLVESGGFNAKDQMTRYVRWYREGYWSSTGRCFDIGNNTSRALTAFEETGDLFSGSTSSSAASNGSVMRLAPAPLYFANQPRCAIDYSGMSSRITHGAAQAVDACRYLGGLIVSATQGASKEDILSDRHTPVGSWEDFGPWHPEIEEVASGGFKRRNPPEIAGTGYAVSTIEAALWGFFNSESFEEGLLKVVNLGDDADTTGAIFGQLAGCYYGLGGIPEKWTRRIARLEEVVDLAERLHGASLSART